jgi:hypothetical protein
MEAVMRELKHRALLALVFGGTSLLGPSTSEAQVSVQFHWGERDQYHRYRGRPLEGRRYQTMALLAHRLDQAAQDLNEDAYRNARHDRGEWRSLAGVADFARRAHDFHSRMDSYLESTWDVGRDVSDLQQRALRLGGGWSYEVDILNRMQETLSGHDVDVPPWERRSPDWYDHNRPGYREHN